MHRAPSSRCLRLFVMNASVVFPTSDVLPRGLCRSRGISLLDRFVWVFGYSEHLRVPAARDRASTSTSTTICCHHSHPHFHSYCHSHTSLFSRPSASDAIGLQLNLTFIPIRSTGYMAPDGSERFESSQLIKKARFWPRLSLSCDRGTVFTPTLLSRPPLRQVDQQGEIARLPLPADSRRLYPLDFIVFKRHLGIIWL